MSTAVRQRKELDPSQVRIIRAGASRLDDVRDLWSLLHHHHLAVADKRIGPVRSESESWVIKRAWYGRWLAEPGSFFLIAECAGTPVGYAFVDERSMETSPHWHKPDRIGWIEDLSILPEAQRIGVGNLLIDAIKIEARRLGIPSLGGVVVVGNDNALEFYDRLGGFRTCVQVEYRYEHDPTEITEVQIIDELHSAGEMRPRRAGEEARI